MGTLASVNIVTGIDCGLQDHAYIFRLILRLRIEPVRIITNISLPGCPRSRTFRDVREVPLADKLARIAVPSALAPALADVARVPIYSSPVAACCGR
jgi:hypothetical protein